MLESTLMPVPSNFLYLFLILQLMQTYLLQMNFFFKNALFNKLLHLTSLNQFLLHLKTNTHDNPH